MPLQNPDTHLERQLRNPSGTHPLLLLRVCLLFLKQKNSYREPCGNETPLSGPGKSARSFHFSCPRASPSSPPRPSTHSSAAGRTPRSARRTNAPGRCSPHLLERHGLFCSTPKKKPGGSRTKANIYKKRKLRGHRETKQNEWTISQTGVGLTWI